MTNKLKKCAIITLRFAKYGGNKMGISVNLPEINIKEDEVKLLLAMKLLEDEIGRAHV